MEEIKIIEEKENPLFKRKEIKLEVSAAVTPSHGEAREIISSKFSKPEENIRIKNILGRFGSKEFTIRANIYESEEDKLKTEGESKKDVVKKQEEPEQAETPEETPKESTPETPEESKPEEKKE